MDLPPSPKIKGGSYLSSNINLETATTHLTMRRMNHRASMKMVRYCCIRSQSCTIDVIWLNRTMCVQFGSMFISSTPPWSSVFIHVCQWHDHLYQSDHHLYQSGYLVARWDWCVLTVTPTQVPNFVEASYPTALFRSPFLLTLSSHKFDFDTICTWLLLHLALALALFLWLTNTTSFEQHNTSLLRRQQERNRQTKRRSIPSAVASISEIQHSEPSVTPWRLRPKLPRGRRFLSVVKRGGRWN